MVVNGTNLHQVEQQLMPLYFEISVLERRVEESNPDVRARCEEPVRSLYDRYKTVENQVQAIHADMEIPDEDFTRVEHNVQDLCSQLKSVGPWVWLQTSD